MQTYLTVDLHKLSKDTRLAIDCIQLVSHFGGSLVKTTSFVEAQINLLTKTLSEQKNVDDELLDALLWQRDRLDFINTYIHERTYNDPKTSG